MALVCGLNELDLILGDLAVTLPGSVARRRPISSARTTSCPTRSSTRESTGRSAAGQAHQPVPVSSPQLRDRKRSPSTAPRYDCIRTGPSAAPPRLSAAADLHIWNHSGPALAPRQSLLGPGTHTNSRKATRCPARNGTLRHAVRSAKSTGLTPYLVHTRADGYHEYPANN